MTLHLVHPGNGHIAPSARHNWASAIRDALRRNPTLTAAELVRQTGAPPMLARSVRERWRFLGEVAR